MTSYKSLEFHLAAAEEVERLILDRIEQERPFSLVRVGDGEGHLLGLDESYRRADLNYFKYHFGQVDFSFLREMQRDLKAAIEGADLVGIRDDMINVRFAGAPFALRLVKSRMNLRKSERNIRAKAARRLYNTVNALSTLERPEEQQYCSAWIHFHLQMSGFFERLLASQSRLVIITSKDRVASLLRSTFSLDVVLCPIPKRFAEVGKPVDYDIDRFRTVNEEIKHLSAGSLFLIGGGLWGKVFAQTVKQNGGYALDIGALIDYWCGEETRPVVMADLIGDRFVRGQVPREMQLLPHIRKGH